MAELETILDFSQGFCGGGSGACINPIFGPTAASLYWSAVAGAGNPANAFAVSFDIGFVTSGTKSFTLYVRAVRTGP